MFIRSIDDAVQYVQSWSHPSVSEGRRRRMLLIAAEGHRRNEASYRIASRLTEAAMSAAIAEYLESSAGVLDAARAG